MDENTKEKKKRGKPQKPVKVKVEIDYDKLAMAIVQAQQKINNTEKEESQEKTDRPFWKKIIDLFIPFQQDRKEEMTLRFFSVIVGGLCWVIGLIGLFLFIPAVYLSFDNIGAYVRALLGYCMGTCLYNYSIAVSLPFVNALG